MEVIAGRAAGRVWRQDQPGDRGDHALGPGCDDAARQVDGFLWHLSAPANGGFNLAYGGQKWGNFISANGLNTGRFLDPPGIRGHARPWQRGESVRPRRLSAFGSTDSIHLNSRLYALVVPDPQFLRHAKCDGVERTGGRQRRSRPQRNSGGSDGSALARSERSISRRPGLASVVSPRGVHAGSAFVRQDQYNYYPSGNPFADFTPDLQSETIGQNRTLTNAGAARRSRLRQRHPQCQDWESCTSTRFSLENDTFGIVDPDVPSDPLSDDANGNPMPETRIVHPVAAPCYNPFLRRLIHARGEARFYHVQRPRRRKGDWRSTSRTPSRKATGLSTSAFAAISTTALQGQRRRSPAGCRLQHQANQHGAARFLCAHLGDPVQREPGAFASMGCNAPGGERLRWRCSSARQRDRRSVPGWRNEFHAGLQQAFGKISGDRRRIHLEIHAQGLSTSACWAIRRSRFRSSGPAPRFPAMPSAPACRTSTACRRSW